MVFKPSSGAHNLLSVVQAILNGHKAEYSQFLEDRCSEWADIVKTHFRKEPVGFTDESANERRLLLREIRTYINQHARRDVKDPWDSKNMLQKVDELTEARQSLETQLKPHPTIERCRAQISALQGDYISASRILENTVAFIENLDFDADPNLHHLRRDQIVHKCDRSYMLRRSGNYDESVEIADQAWPRFTSYSNDRGEEGMANDVKNYNALPNYSPPLGAVVCLALCDSRIGHKDWSPSSKFNEEFNFAWQKSLNEFGAPKSWTVPMKIGCLSDPDWVAKCRHRVDEIAKSLYVDTADSRRDRVWRRLDMYVGGFQITYPTTATSAVIAAALLGVLHVGSVPSGDLRNDVAFASPETIEQGFMSAVKQAASKQDVSSDMIEQARLELKEHLGGVDFNEHSDALVANKANEVFAAFTDMHASVSDEGSVYQI